MANTKMTKKDYFETIRDLVSDRADLVEFIDHEFDLLNRKSSTPRKPSATQKENETFKADILAALATVTEPVTIRGLCDVCPSIAELSNQRITHMLTALRADGKVKRTYVKKVAYFALGCEEEVEK